MRKLGVTKKVLSILLCICMVLSCMPMTAFATEGSTRTVYLAFPGDYNNDEYWISDDTYILFCQDAEGNEIGRVSCTTTVYGQSVADLTTDDPVYLKAEIPADTSVLEIGSSDSDSLFDDAQLDDHSIYVLGNGWESLDYSDPAALKVYSSNSTVAEGETAVYTVCDTYVTNNGTILAGRFRSPVTNNGTIAGGYFDARVTNEASGTITGGTYGYQIINSGTITGGVFTGYDDYFDEDWVTTIYNLDGGDVSAVRNSGAVIIESVDITVNFENLTVQKYYFDADYNWIYEDPVSVSPYTDKTTPGEYYTLELKVTEDNYAVPDEITVTIGGVESDSYSYDISDDSKSADVWIWDIAQTDDIVITAAGYEPVQSPVTKLIVGDTVVADKGIIKGAVSGNGWSYDVESNTLTLTDANIAPTVSQEGYESFGVYCEGELNVVVNGNNTISVSKMDDESSLYGIYVSDDLSISGAGTLNISTGDTTSGYCMGINCNETITVDGPTLNVTSGNNYYSMAMNTNSFVLTSGSVTLSSGEGSGVYDFLSYNAAINGGTLTLTTDDLNKANIYCGGDWSGSGTVIVGGKQAIIVAGYLCTAGSELTSGADVDMTGVTVPTYYTDSDGTGYAVYVPGDDLALSEMTIGALTVPYAQYSALVDNVKAYKNGEIASIVLMDGQTQLAEMQLVDGIWSCEGSHLFDDWWQCSYCDVWAEAVIETDDTATFYLTLGEAIREAESGSTVTLLPDETIGEDETVTIPDGVTLVLPDSYSYDTIPEGVTGGTVVIDEKSYTWNAESGKWVCGEGSHTGGGYSLNQAGDTIIHSCTVCEATLGTAKISAEGKTYDGEAVEASVTCNITGGTAPQITYCCDGGCTNVGDHTAKIKLGNAEAKVSFAITAATPTVAWENTTQAVTYTGSAAEIPAPVVSLVNNEAFVGTITYLYTGTSSGTGLPTDAGTYEITASIAAQGNYTAATSANTLTLTIDKAPAPVITFPTILNEIVYGQRLQDAKLSFYENEYGTFNWAAPDGVPDKVGLQDYALDFYPSADALQNYDWAADARWIESRSALCAMGRVRVDPADIADYVRIFAPTADYDGTARQIQVVNTGDIDASGLTEGTDYTIVYENVDAADRLVNGLPVFAGDYKVTLTGMGNYTGTVTKVFKGNVEDVPVYADVMTIRPATLIVDEEKLTANDKVYDGTKDATLSDLIVSGIVAGDDVSVQTTVSFSDANVGSGKTVTVSFSLSGADSGNYAIYELDEPLTADITPKQVSVTAKAASKTYGEADPELTYTVDGLIGDDKLTGVLERAAGENVGTYAIMVGSLANSHYTISFTSADLTINRKPIAAADVKLNGSLAYTGSEQTQAVTVTEGITYEVSGNQATDVGTYELTVTGTGNYTGEVKLSWSIKETAAVVTAAPTAKELTYTGDDQALVNAGTTADGKLVYSLTEDGEYTEKIPTGNAAGDYTVWYYVQGDENHSDSAKASVAVKIEKADQVITMPEPVTEALCGGTVKLPAADAEGTITYESSDSAVAKINAATGEITAVTAGTVTVTITAAETGNYKKAVEVYTLTVSHSHVSNMTAPTCTGQGYTTYKCHCGDEYVTDYVEALGHTYSDDRDDSCNRCGAKRKTLVETTPMYRLYNPNSGEHFYTGSIEERNNLAAAGWKYEGVAWNAPVYIGDPVYRVYNPNSGDHHFTMSREEVDDLVELGWKYEGIAWNSAPVGNVPQYRLYNPNADCGSHHYTGSMEERENLVALGWIYEGIGWFGMLK